MIHRIRLVERNRLVYLKKKNKKNYAGEIRSRSCEIFSARKIEGPHDFRIGFGARLRSSSLSRQNNTELTFKTKIIIYMYKTKRLSFWDKEKKFVPSQTYT